MYITVQRDHVCVCVLLYFVCVLQPLSPSKLYSTMVANCLILCTDILYEPNSHSAGVLNSDTILGTECGCNGSTGILDNAHSGVK